MSTAILVKRKITTRSPGYQVPVSKSKTRIKDSGERFENLSYTSLRAWRCTAVILKERVVKSSVKEV